MREKIAEWLNAYTDEMLADLGELVAIRSVKGHPHRMRLSGQNPDGHLTGC